jgi:tetratricopeptide (TPR) repeat protein
MSEPEPEPKQLKVLIAVLTSDDVNILDLCFNSIVTQIPKIPATLTERVSFHPVVIVNTLKEGYYGEVCTRLKDKYNFTNVIQTESNGKPGKGHNSVLEYFRNCEEYDWLMPIDGDDMLYYTALQQFALFLCVQHEVDILVHNSSGKVKWNAERGNIAITRGAFLEMNYGIITEVIAMNPFDDKNTIGTPGVGVPGRILLLNRRAITVCEPHIIYDEGDTLYDDYPPLLAAFHHHFNGTLKIAYIKNASYTYVYNQLTNKSVTQTFTNSGTFTNPAKLEQQRVAFKQSIAPFRHLNAIWDSLKTIPWIQLIPEELESDIVQSIYQNNTIPSAVKYLQDTIVKHYLNEHLHTLIHLVSIGKWEDYLKSYDILYSRYPELLANEGVIMLRFNAGVSMFNLKKYDTAIYQFHLALKACTDSHPKMELIKKNMALCKAAPVTSLHIKNLEKY